MVCPGACRHPWGGGRSQLAKHCLLPLNCTDAQSVLPRKLLHCTASWLGCGISIYQLVVIGPGQLPCKLLTFNHAGICRRHNGPSVGLTYNPHLFVIDFYYFQPFIHSLACVMAAITSGVICTWWVFNSWRGWRNTTYYQRKWPSNQKIGKNAT